MLNKIMLLIFCTTFGLFAEINWQAEQTLSLIDGLKSSDADIKMDNNGVLHAVWSDKFSTGVNGYVIVYSKKVPGGNWTQPYGISDMGYANNPKVFIAPNNDLHVFYMNGYQFSDYGILRHRIHSAGLPDDVWGTYNKVTDSDSSIVEQTTSISCIFDESNGQPIVAWDKDFRLDTTPPTAGYRGDIYTASYNGSSWSTNLCLSNNSVSPKPYTALYPHLLKFKGKTTCFFEEFEGTTPKLYYKTVDNGIWGASSVINTGVNKVVNFDVLKYDDNNLGISFSFSASGVKKFVYYDYNGTDLSNETVIDATPGSDLVALTAEKSGNFVHFFSYTTKIKHFILNRNDLAVTTGNTFADYTRYPTVISDNNQNLHLVYHAGITPTDFEVKYQLGLVPTSTGTSIPSGSEISGTWTKNNSPYIVEGKATVPNGQTLNIEPGVVVKFKASTSIDPADYTYQTIQVGMLYINGKISAAGTVAEPVIFTRNETEGNWGTIIFDDASDDNSILSHCVIEYACTVKKFDGTNDMPGAVSFHKANPTIEYCVIKNNGKSFGGYDLGCGILSFRSSPKIISCQIFNNKTQGFYGISDYQQNTTPLLIGNLIYNNKPAIDLVFTDPKIVNCTVTNNQQCGLNGMYANPIIINSIFWNNQASFNQSSSSIKASYSVLQETALPAGVVNQGNLLLGYNPDFINPIENNFSLQSSSLCINIGNESISGITQPDFDCYGNQRIYGTKIDLGAAEYNNTEINKIDGENCLIASNYPNPFNNMTVIRYELPQTAQIKLTVYNAKGELVRILANGMQNAGQYNVNFDGNGLNSGLYFYKLEAQGICSIKKMMMLK